LLAEQEKAEDTKKLEITEKIKAANIAITSAGEEIKTNKEKIADFDKKIAEQSKIIADATAKIAAAELAIKTADVVADLLDPDSKLSAEERHAGLQAIGGEAHASLRTVLLGNTQLRNVAQARMAGLHADRLAAGQSVLTASTGTPSVSPAMLNAPANRIWANTWGYDGKTTGNRDAADVNQRGQGIAAGVDVGVTENVSAGVLLGFEDGKITSGGVRKANTTVKSYSVGSYASAALGGVDLQAGVIYSRLDIDTHRDMAALGLGDAKASYKGYKVQAFAEGSRAFDVSDAATVAPYVNLTQTWLHTNAAQERGTTLLPLDVKAQNDSVFQTTLGVRAVYRLPTATPVSVTANLGWAHAFGDTAAKVSNHFAGADSRMTVKGSRMDKDRALVGVGVEALVAKNTTVALAYNGQFGAKDRDHAGSLQVKVRF